MLQDGSVPSLPQEHRWTKISVLTRRCWCCQEPITPKGLMPTGQFSAVRQLLLSRDAFKAASQWRHLQSCVTLGTEVDGFRRSHPTVERQLAVSLPWPWELMDRASHSRSDRWRLRVPPLPGSRREPLSSGSVCCVVMQARAGLRSTGVKEGRSGHVCGCQGAFISPSRAGDSVR